MAGAASVSGSFPAGGVCYVGGRNAAGKSSALAGLGMCLTGDVNPYRLPASQRVQYVRAGAEKAFAELEVEGVFHATASPTDGAKTLVGALDAPTLAVSAAAGFADPLSWRRSDWNRLFSETRLSFERFAAALARDLDLEGGETAARAIYAEVERRGVSDVAAEYEESSRRAKHDWEAAVGEGRRYGSATAASWRPEGYLPEWEGQSAESAEEELRHAEERLTLLRASAAATESEARKMRDRVQRGKDAARPLKAMEEQMREDKRVRAEKEKEYQTNFAKMAAEEARLTRELEDLPNQAPLTCPCCDREVVLKDGELVPADGGVLTKGDIELALRETKEALKNKTAELDALKAEWNKFNEADEPAFVAAWRTIEQHRQAVAEGEKASAWLNQNAEAAAREVSENEIVVAENEAAAARQKRECMKRLLKARRAHAASAQNAAAAKSLRRGAVSAEYEKIGLSAVSGWLGRLGKVFGARVEIIDGSVSYNGRASRFCSESEQWTARTFLQISLALSFGLPAALIDRFDVLDLENRVRWLDFFREKWSGANGVALFVAGTSAEGWGSGDCDLLLENGTTKGESSGGGEAG